MFSQTKPEEINTSWGEGVLSYLHFVISFFYEYPHPQADGTTNSGNLTLSR